MLSNISVSLRSKDASLLANFCMSYHIFGKGEGSELSLGLLLSGTAATLGIYAGPQ